MGNVHKWINHYRHQTGDMSTALGGETSDVITTPTFVSMANYDLVVGLAQVSNVVSTHVVTLQAYEATSTAGAGSTAISGASDTYTSTQATDLDILITQVRGEDLSTGYQYVGFKVSTDDADGTEVASVFIIEGRARYKQATMPT